MRNSNHLRLIAILALLILPATAWGQPIDEPAFLVHGGTGSGNVFIQFDSNATIHADCGCAVPEGRRGTRNAAGGFGVRLSLGPAGSFTGRLSLVARLGFVETPARWTLALPDALVLLPGQTTPVNQRIEDRLEFTIRDLGVESLVLFNPVADLGIGVGGSLGWRDLAGFRYTRNVLEPQNARLVNPTSLPTENGGRTVMLSGKQDQDLNSISASAIATILYTIDLGGSVAIVPEVDYRVDLVKPFNHSTWESTMVLALLSFRYRR